MKLFAIETIVLLGAACLAACAVSTTPRTDEQFGESMGILKAQQVLNPDASRNTDPVTGLDSKSAKSALDNYHNSFRKPAGGATSNTLTIGVGSGANATEK